MNDRAILVTGSSSGIGKAIVAALLEAGAQVIGVSRTKSTAFSKNTSYTDINVDIGAVSYTHLTLPTNREV